MNQTKATTAQLEATAPPLTTKKVPRATIEMGCKDLMPFHFWLDCFEFNNLRGTYECLCAIERACAADFNHLAGRSRNWQGSMWEAPVASHAEMAAVQEALDLAMFKHEDAMFAREVLEVELENHKYFHGCCYYSLFEYTCAAWSCVGY